MKHVLIVDDDRTTVRLLTMMLELDGFQVSQSARPDNALEVGRGGEIDLFIIDCNLAGYSGVDLLQSIRADAALAAKPVIMTSGRDHEVEVMAAGANFFFLKPFSPSELTAKLTELLS